MQLTLQLPALQTCSDSVALETSSNASSLSWFTTVDVGPPTPAAKCGLHTHRSTASSANSQADHHLVYRRLQVTVPSTRAPQCDDSSPRSILTTSARRVLPISENYSRVCDWLDQQVSKRSSNGKLLGVCSRSPVALDPAAVLQGPTTPVQEEEPCAGLPAPAFQLLGLL